MTTETITLSSFLLARVAEDEAAAWYAGTEAGTLSDHDTKGWWIGIYQHYTRHTPARVLTDCAARRAIVELRDRANSADKLMDRLVMPTAVAAFDATLRTLATVYSDHPDYSEDWRP